MVLSSITVEVVYALPEKQYIQRVTTNEGVTVEEAISISGLLKLRKEIDLSKIMVGIYGKPVRLEHVIRHGDRIEIYRPLIANPRDLRRYRAKILK